MYYNYEESVLQRLQKTELEILKDFIHVCDKYSIHYFVIEGTAIGAVRHQGFIPWDDDIDVGMLREDYCKFAKVFDKELGEKYILYGPDRQDTYYNFVPGMSKKGTRFTVDLAYQQYDVGIFIDLFILDNIPREEKKQRRLISRTMFWRNLYVVKNANFSPLFHNADAVSAKLKYLLIIGLHKILNLLKIKDSYIYSRYKKRIIPYYKKTDYYTILGDPNSYIHCMGTDDIFPLKKVRFEDIEVCIPNHYDKMLRLRYGDYMKIPPQEKRVNHAPMQLEFERQ